MRRVGQERNKVMGWMICCYDRQCPARICGHDHDDCERKAAAAGWQMGLAIVSAQAYYTCPDCAPGLVACHPIVPAAA